MTSIIKVNIVELASELADYELTEILEGCIKITEEDDNEIRYTDKAQDIFNDLYDKYYSLIENCKINEGTDSL